ncbi:MAG: OpgC domain-containing protein, partial [Pseudomonadota bacterium]
MRDHADQKRAGDGSAGAPDAAERERRRDTRLDFFRGVGMFIILIAHTPANTWNKWIPARFGYSDATEIFVFCSGAASAIAFLKVFQMKGFWIGTSRVSYRIWQIYWCHIGVFMAVAATLVGVDVLMESGRTYENRLNLTPFFGNEGIESAPFAHDTGSQLFGLMTLSYVPNLF